MVPARYARILFAFIMSGLMAFLMSGVVTALNTGVDAAFVGRWADAFIHAWPIAFPAVLLVAPFAQRLTALLLIREQEA